MRVIGIDPGTAIVGYGIVDYEKTKFNLVEYGCIYTDKNIPMDERLCEIYAQLSTLLDKHMPTHMAIEELFYFRNSTTVISVGQARGVLLLAAKQKGLEIKGYTPLQVKMGITGYGKADKLQVQQMVQRFLNLKEIPKPDDAADAIAIAITHINAMGSLTYGLNSKKPLSGKAIKKDKMTAKEFRELMLQK
ncbi:MAG: crossover junction endodeoxyribonuclease RuvC [Fusobacteriaceae bacterium]|jgi:crossover junction endodeoxyribonuclease RuvC|nr:crossover junction endodeoxyribonuclease RuvC [Fusobacteriaceae bacterium]